MWLLASVFGLVSIAGIICSEDRTLFAVLLLASVVSFVGGGVLEFLQRIERK
jgi:hypothetical protein